LNSVYTEKIERPSCPTGLTFENSFGANRFRSHDAAPHRGRGLIIIIIVTFVVFFIFTYIYSYWRNPSLLWISNFWCDIKKYYWYLPTSYRYNFQRKNKEIFSYYYWRSTHWNSSSIYYIIIYRKESYIQKVLKNNNFQKNVDNPQLYIIWARDPFEFIYYYLLWMSVVKHKCIHQYLKSHSELRFQISLYLSGFFQQNGFILLATPMKNICQIII